MSRGQSAASLSTCNLITYPAYVTSLVWRHLLPFVHLCRRRRYLTSRRARGEHCTVWRRHLTVHFNIMISAPSVHCFTALSVPLAVKAGEYFRRLFPHKYNSMCDRQADIAVTPYPHSFIHSFIHPAMSTTVRSLSQSHFSTHCDLVLHNTLSFP